MKQHIPLYRFFATQHQRRVGELRGGPVFDLISKDDDYGITPGVGFVVHQETERGLPMGRGVMFVDLSVALDVLPRIRSECQPAVIILDVHFALTAPERIFTFDDEGNIDHDASWELAKHWASPEIEARALAEVAAADAVTVPYQSFADALKSWNKNVIVLPDVQDLDSAVNFYSIFTTTVLSAMRRKSYGWLRRALTAVLFPFVRNVVRDNAKLLRCELIERGWQ